MYVFMLVLYISHATKASYFRLDDESRVESANIVASMWPGGDAFAISYWLRYLTLQMASTDSPILSDLGLSDADRLIKLRPYSSSGYEYRAYFQYRSGQRLQAADDLRKAMSLDPSNMSAYRTALQSGDEDLQLYASKNISEAGVCWLPFMSEDEMGMMFQLVNGLDSKRWPNALLYRDAEVAFIEGRNGDFWQAQRRLAKRIGCRDLSRAPTFRDIIDFFREL